MDDKRLLDQMIGNLVLLSAEDLETLRKQVIKEETYRQMATRPAHNVSRGAW